MALTRARQFFTSTGYAKALTRKYQRTSLETAHIASLSPSNQAGKSTFKEPLPAKRTSFEVLGYRIPSNEFEIQFHDVFVRPFSLWSA
jgi:hypothetical protein